VKNVRPGPFFFSWGGKLSQFFRNTAEKKDFSPLRRPARPIPPQGSGAEGEATLMERLRLRVPIAEGTQRGILLVLIVSVMGSVALGLTLVWLNTERTRLALRAHALQQELEAHQELNAKLEVEHASLVSPDVLMKKAGSLGLRAALPGEIRRMESVAPLEPDTDE
jgi:hypothetical protein